ncbi:LemA family protein [Candidatus Gracilibacteria bacterium]|nr:LemA family protein [Candidatus Gracilibacteria bacterium]
MNSTNNTLSTGKVIGLVVLGVLVVVMLWSFTTYNSLISLSENVKQEQANVEVQYQRRFDLIPNLVNTVQGIFDQEKSVFQALAMARSRYAGSREGTAEREQAINEVETSLSRLLVVVENYPQLRSSEAVNKLMDQLEGTENRISVARTKFNDVVTSYNKKIKTFPSVVIAGMFNFDENNRFQATAAAQTAPAVNFDVK